MTWLDHMVSFIQSGLMDLFGMRANEVTWAFWTVTVATLCNVSCALLGCYLVLRRLSLLGDAISHGVLPGIALAFFLSGQIGGWTIVLGALIFGMLTAFLTQAVTTHGKVPEDASLGVVYTSLFALGVVLISQVGQKTHLDADCVLYGRVDLVALDTFTLWGYEVPVALRTLAPVMLLTLLFVIFFWKELKTVSFDPALATAMGFSAALLHYLLMGMVAAVTVASFEVVGSILVIAMLIVPAATAHLLTDRLSRMMWVATLVAVLSAVFGYLCATWLDSSTAAMMAVVAGIQFTLAVFLAPRHGIISKVIRNARLGLRILREDILAVLYRAEEAHQRGDRSVAGVSLTDLQKVAPGFAGRFALRMLHWKSLIDTQPQQLTQLTDKGRKHGQLVVRSHRLWESFLEEKLQLPLDHLHEPAHAMEHFIGPELQSELENQLKQSDTDPHGREIPPGRK